MARSFVNLLRELPETLFRLEDRGPVAYRSALRLGKLAWLTGRKIHRDLCFERAASLAFTTIVGAIPIAILSLFLFGSSGGVTQMIDEGKRFVLDTFVPQSGAPAAPKDDSVDGDTPRGTTREEVATLLDAVIQRLKDSVPSWATQGAVTLSAIVALLLAVPALFRSAERTFSVIWNAESRRTFAQQLGVYWMLLTLPPLILLLAGLLRRSLGEPGFVTLLFGASISFFAFTLIYLYLPNARVHMDAAAVGALVAALGWEAGVRAFGVYVQHAALANIYGALAVVPFSLIFIFYAWMLTLIGCEVSYCYQHFAALEREVRYHLGGQSVSRPVEGLLILEAVYKGFTGSGPQPTVDTLASGSQLPIALLEELLSRLHDAGYVVTGRNGVITPTRAADQVRLLEVVQAFPPGTGLEPKDGGAAASPLRDFLHSTAARLNGDLAGKTFQDLVPKGDRNQVVQPLPT